MDIKSARIARGWTQQQLAQELGVSRGAVAQWEMKEGTRPDPRHAVSLTKLLASLTLADIYAGNDAQGRAAA